MRNVRLLRATFCGVVMLVGLAMACSGDGAPEGAVHRMRLDGSIGPITERYIDRGLDRAEDNNARFAVIELDTPGGLDSSMREIVQRIESSDVPVAVYVSPSGARAASAGTFITMSAHIAAMAPNTSIGAASAINSDGSDIEGTLGRKIENDAVAFIRGIADLRGRNADWAEDAVRDAVAATNTKAVELNVVDFTANDFDDLLAQSEGRTVELRPGITAELRGLQEAEVVNTEFTAFESFLEFIADPTIASLLITLGFLGLIFEMSNPGLFIPGAAGIVMLVLGFLGFGMLPVDTAGLLLVALGFALIALELVIPGGVVGGIGLLALAIGAIIAFRDTPADLRPSYFVFGLLAFVFVGMFTTIAMGINRVRKTSAAIGTEALVGKLATVRSPLTPEGYVFVHGERWKAQIDDGKADTGDKVRIIGADGFRLRVHKEDSP
jgi:membrane-bound serine protease (ClpP class)